MTSRKREDVLVCKEKDTFAEMQTPFIEALKNFNF